MPKKRSALIVVRSTPDGLKLLDQAAEAKNITRSNYVRLAIEKQLVKDGWLNDI